MPFADRHIGPRHADLERLLSVVGVDSLDELIDQAVPSSIRQSAPLDLPSALDETEMLAELREIASTNIVRTPMIGLGYAGTHTPPVIRRNVLESPAWYTAYTPYQPEISQGRLEALLNFQTMITDLTGTELANSSLLDEGTAAAEAMAMSRRLAKGDRNRFLIQADTFPQTIAVIETRAEAIGVIVDVVDDVSTTPLSDVCGVLVQYPACSGAVVSPKAAIDAAHEGGAVAVVATDLLACTILTPPGELGADIVVGSSQRFGVPLGFGGPHAGFMGCRDDYKRTMPGRLVGVSVDAAGRPATRLALQTREQHIRREKATSNICTAQVLLAVIASMYAVYHGPEGLRAIAERTHRLADAFASACRAAGLTVDADVIFDTVTVGVPGRAPELVARAASVGIDLRLIDADTLSVAFDETSTVGTLALLGEAFDIEIDADVEGAAVPEELRRSSDYLTHPTFHAYRSETDLLRYLRMLSDRDIALDRAMIPLGSCTMKLNATVEMEPVTWPEFGGIHPFAPAESTRGYRRLIEELEAWLVEVTGYDAISFQPNAGSQGEFAGLLAIRAFHRANGDDHRTTCLIPSSAHGTNAASAVMAGMRVVVVACDENGNVDLEDLEAKIAAHADDLAALMVTYPSTHGVYETTITDICEMVHGAGGQVYLDGANLNALVGVAKPGAFGADVSHLNLHKTFCIPHGGGGPGVGPVAVRAHLAAYLPSHPLDDECGPATGPGPISAAPYGSAGILPISWAYVRMMGGDGLTEATRVAILNANYIAVRLAARYPVLYTGAHGRVAHECIVDLRDITKRTGVTVDDVAKRLIDYGFHAPTMSFPVAGTFMIEPTESESLEEIDRFCDAMIAIADEIAEIESGATHADSALAHAPHTAEDLLVSEWDRPYSREQAAYPVRGLRTNKYWPPVSRIDGAAGDRNLVCACPPPEAFEELTEA
ncbi:aminomethyl-transferring glycine dehydrogenase [Actinospongicola halichondriae]|uniref:aminomethyl-transferring glycine dehydrogenase n=1 Tax=Actinospongicola halichondriae TaxID=3236844 RepID=UPI003D5A54E8